MANRPQRDRSEWAAPGYGDLGVSGMQFARFAARNQAELVNLFSCRASAYLEFPARLSQCSSLADLLREQLGFLTVMQRHYFEAAQHMLEPLGPQATKSQPGDRGVQPAPTHSPKAVTGGSRRDAQSDQGTRRAA